VDLTVWEVGKDRPVNSPVGTSKFNNFAAQMTGEPLEVFTLTDLEAERKTSNYLHTSQRPILLLRQKHTQC
jgi:hypothetical protein